MKKIELNISNKPLYNNTKEDKILKSPVKIPPKELQSLSVMKGINLLNYAYYDISKTENQGIVNNTIINTKIFFIVGYTTEEGNIRMGNF